MLQSVAVLLKDSWENWTAQKAYECMLLEMFSENVVSHSLFSCTIIPPFPFFFFWVPVEAAKEWYYFVLVSACILWWPGIFLSQWKTIFAPKQFLKIMFYLCQNCKVRKVFSLLMALKGWCWLYLIIQFVSHCNSKADSWGNWRINRIKTYATAREIKPRENLFFFYLYLSFIHFTRRP